MRSSQKDKFNSGVIEYHASEQPNKSFLERLDEFKRQNQAKKEDSSQKMSESENKALSVRDIALHQEPCPAVDLAEF